LSIKQENNNTFVVPTYYTWSGALKGKICIGLLIALMLLSGCTSIFEEPHNFRVSSTCGSEVGNGSFTLNIRVYDGCSDVPLPGSAVVMYYKSVENRSGGNGDYQYTVLKGLLSAVTNESGNVIAHIDPTLIYCISAKHTGYTTEDHENVIIGNEMNNETTYNLPLYTETINFTLNGEISFAVDAVVVEYLNWYPSSYQLCCSEQMERLISISAQLHWVNNLNTLPPSISDLGMAVGEPGYWYQSVNAKDDTLTQGECSEQITLDYSVIQDVITYGLQNQNNIYFGAYTDREYINCPYTISGTLVFKGSDAIIEFYN
jgi:hypothetical protein